jgi:hypothetical protein
MVMAVVCSKIFKEDFQGLEEVLVKVLGAVPDSEAVPQAPVVHKCTVKKSSDLYVLSI